MNGLPESVPQSPCDVEGRKHLDDPGWRGDAEWIIGGLDRYRGADAWMAQLPTNQVSSDSAQQT
jgi:hypothetical protein